MTTLVSGITDTVASGPLLLAALLALAAGVVSFASPCVVPLVPGYLSYLAGLVGADTARTGDRVPAPMPQGDTVALGDTVAPGGRTVVSRPAKRMPAQRIRWRALGATGLFVAGFSAVFVAESVLVLGIYTTIIANQALLVQISGGVAIVMGIVLALPALQREWRPGMRAVRRPWAGHGRLWGAPVLGVAFGTGWLACTSPTLAGILALSYATEWNDSAVRGIVLVLLYCAGLGIPFLLLSIGFGWATTMLDAFRRHARGIQLGGAIVLVMIGVLMLTGAWGRILAPLRGTVLWL